MTKQETCRDPCRVCRLVILIGTDDAITGARTWSIERARALGGCFLLWEIESASAPFVRISVRDISDGVLGPAQEFQRRGINPERRFGAIHPELADGRGRIGELVIFHHGSQVKEKKVVDALQEILVQLRRVPVCRLIYWACNAAVELDVREGAGIDVLMKAFGALAQQEPCGCDNPVELIHPTPGRCAITRPGVPLRIFTADGLVRRIRYGYRLSDGSLSRDPDPGDPQPTRAPQDRDGATESGSVLGVPVESDPSLGQ
ncbi:MAG: hypothetical protein ACREX3_15055 [Gammaproteobacteria bacterium]